MERAKRLLAEGGYTCVLCKGDAVYTSVQRGVRPLVTWLESDEDLSGCVAADKVVGKATAFLYVLLGARVVYARVISRAALAVLERYGIETAYDRLAQAIINRQGDGVCPFEEAVTAINDPDEAYAVICRKLAQMTATAEKADDVISPS